MGRGKRAIGASAAAASAHRRMKPELVEDADGTRNWYLNNQRHREDGPAIEFADGGRVWYLNGELHREDGPAYEGADGTRWWYVNNQRHREDGRAPDQLWSIYGAERTQPAANAGKAARPKNGSLAAICRLRLPVVAYTTKW
jgi:hypothetical protein